ncbi:MAG: hypothetical protein M0R40_08370 [Firmicutes bacterium]|nr:hypothetical protein [Bacillota bacterium]
MDTPKVSKTQQSATAKYVRNNYDRMEIKVPKGKKQVIQDIAQAQGESLNGYVKKAVKGQIKADTGQDIDL